MQRGAKVVPRHNSNTVIGDHYSVTVIELLRHSECKHYSDTVSE